MFARDGFLNSDVNAENATMRFDMEIKFIQYLPKCTTGEETVETTAIRGMSFAI
jgi:hypothetical protein